MRLFKLNILAITFCGISFLAGCSFPANPKSMTVTPKTKVVMALTNIETLVKANPKLLDTTTVTKVTGGQKTRQAPFGIANIENEALRKALEDSLNAYGYLASSPKKAKYKVEAQLLSIYWDGLDKMLEHINAGSSFRPNVYVQSSIRYKIYSANFEKEFIATTRDLVNPRSAFGFDKCLKVALETSTRSNIQKLLQYLDSKL